MPAALSVSTKSGKEILVDDSFLQYMEIISFLLGIDNYDKFSHLSDDERAGYIDSIKRHIKIKTIFED